MIKQVLGDGTYTVKDILKNISKGSSNYNDSILITKKIKLDPETCGSDYWTIVTNMSVAKSELASFELGGYGYIVNGYSDDYSNKTDRYDDNLNIWQNKADTPYSCAYGNSFVLNDFAYALMGQNTTILSYISRYDNDANVWILKNNAHNRSNFGAFKLTDFGYLCFGTDGVLLSNIAQYNDETDTCAIIATTITNRTSLIGYELNDYGYIYNGFNTAGLNEINKYDNAINYWITRQANILRYSNAYFNLYNTAFCSYGQTDTTCTNQVSQYVDSADYWLNKNTANTARRSLTGFALNAVGYTCGGRTSDTIGTNNSNEVNKYCSTSSYQILEYFKKSTKQPVSINASTTLNDVVLSLPLQIRTNKTDWKTFSSLKPITKSDQTIADVLTPNNNWYYYEMKIGIPNFAMGTGNGLWINKGTLSPTMQFGGDFTIDSHGYITHGLRNGVAANTMQQYNHFLNNLTNISCSGTSTARYKTAACSRNEQGYIFGGYTTGWTTALTTYNKANNTYSQTNMAHPTNSRPCAFSTAMQWGCIARAISLGSLTNFHYFNSNPLSYTGMDLTEYNQSCFVLNEICYLAGGDDNSSVISTTRNFNLIWSPSQYQNLLQSDLIARKYATGFAVGQYGYACGGCNYEESTSYSTVTQYNVATNNWTRKNDFLYNTHGNNICVINNMPFCFDGSTISQYVSIENNNFLTVALNIKE